MAQRAPHKIEKPSALLGPLHYDVDQPRDKDSCGESISAMRDSQIPRLDWNLESGDFHSGLKEYVEGVAQIAGYPRLSAS